MSEEQETKVLDLDPMFEALDGAEALELEIKRLRLKVRNQRRQLRHQAGDQGGQFAEDRVHPDGAGDHLRGAPPAGPGFATPSLMIAA